MALTPEQISECLKQAGFHSPHATKKKALWRRATGEPVYVNLSAANGTSALILAPDWMAKVGQLQSIPGVVPGQEYYHSTNMTAFPKRKHRGENPIPYGLPITLESESGLRSLLNLVSGIKGGMAETDASSASAEPKTGSGLGHYQLLAWFEQYAGQVLTWDQLQAAPDVVTISAKGIYKPKSLPYALSIRQALGSPYSDQDPEYQEDGSWRYRYAQEEDPNGNSAALFTNQGLNQCMLDQVPVAVLRQVSRKPEVTRYQVMGLARVVAWEDGVFTLQSTTLSGERSAALVGARMDPEGFDPQGAVDNRMRALREITMRQGQPAFRSGLLTAYEGRCAISGCTVTQVLEAAHITPYLGPETNHISNGLLLRSDLHTLWDKGLIFLDNDYTVRVKSCLGASEYADLQGSRVFLPQADEARPSLAAIQAHREWCESTA